MMNSGFRRLGPVSAMLLAVPFLASPGAVFGDTGGATKGVKPREVVLDNGLKLLLIERHEQPMFAAGVFYKVGGVDDPRGKSGIAHLFEHMLFKGSSIVGTSNYEAEIPLMQQEDRLWETMNAENRVVQAK